MILRRREHAQSREIRITLEPLPAHDERIHDWLAETGQFRERAAKLQRRHLQHFRFRGSDPRGRQRRGALEHGDVADEIALPGRAENLLGLIACLEDFRLAAQDHRERRIALARAENNVPTFQAPAFA